MDFHLEMEYLITYIVLLYDMNVSTAVKANTPDLPIHGKYAWSPIQEL